MLRLIDRYVVGSFLGALFNTLIFMIGLYLLVHFISHVGDIDKAREGFAAEGLSTLEGFSRYYALNLPEILVFFGPYAILLAASFSIHQLNQNNELTPMYAVGVSRLRVATPVLIAGLLLTFGLMAVKEMLIPRNAIEMSRIHDVLRGRGDELIDDIPLIGDGRGNVFIIGGYDQGLRQLVDVHVQPKDQDGALSFDRLEWRDDHWVGIADGREETLGAFTDLDPLDIELETDARTKQRLSFSRLRGMIERRPERRELAVALHAHVAYAFTPMVLLLIGIPLVMRSRRKNVFAGLGLCLVLSLCYFSATLILQRMGAQGDLIPPILAAWMPQIVFGSLGLIFFEGIT